MRPHSAPGSLHARLSRLKHALRCGAHSPGEVSGEPVDFLEAARLWQQIDERIERDSSMPLQECCALVAKCAGTLAPRHGKVRALVAEVRDRKAASIENALRGFEGLSEENFYLACLLLLDALAGNENAVEAAVVERVVSAVEAYVARGLRVLVNGTFEERVFGSVPFDAAKRLLDLLTDTGGHRYRRVCKLHPTSALEDLFLPGNASQDLARIVVSHFNERDLEPALRNYAAGHTMDSALHYLALALVQSGRLAEAEAFVFRIMDEERRDWTAWWVIQEGGAAFYPSALERLLSCVREPIRARARWVRCFTEWACSQGLLEEAESQLHQLRHQIDSHDFSTSSGTLSSGFSGTAPRPIHLRLSELNREYSEAITRLIYGCVQPGDWRRALRLLCIQPNGFRKQISLKLVLFNLYPQVPQGERLEFATEAADVVLNFEDPDLRASGKAGLLRLFGDLGSEEAWDFARAWIDEVYACEPDCFRKGLVNSVRIYRLNALACRGDWAVVAEVYQDLEADLSCRDALGVALVAAAEQQWDVYEKFLQKFQEAKGLDELTQQEGETLQFIDRIKEFYDASLNDTDLERGAWFTSNLEFAQKLPGVALLALGRMLIASEDFPKRALTYQRIRRAIWVCQDVSEPRVYFEILDELEELCSWHSGNAELLESAEDQLDEPILPVQGEGPDPELASAREELLLRIETNTADSYLEFNLLQLIGMRVRHGLSEEDRNSLLLELQKRSHSSECLERLNTFREACFESADANCSSSHALLHQAQHYPVESALEIVRQEPGGLLLMQCVTILLKRAVVHGQVTFFPEILDFAQSALSRSVGIMYEEALDSFHEWISAVGLYPDLPARRAYLNRIWDWFSEFPREHLNSLKTAWISEMIAAGGDQVGEARLAEVDEASSRVDGLLRIAARLGIHGVDPRAKHFLDRYEREFEQIRLNRPRDGVFPLSLTEAAKFFADAGDQQRVRTIVLLASEVIQEGGSQIAIYDMAHQVFRAAARLGLADEILTLLEAMPAPHSGNHGISWFMASFLAFDKEARVSGFEYGQRLRLMKYLNPILVNENPAGSSGEALALLAALAECPETNRLLRHFREESSRPEQVAGSVSYYFRREKLPPALMMQLSILAPYSMGFAVQLVYRSVEMSVESGEWKHFADLLDPCLFKAQDFWKNLAELILDSSLARQPSLLAPAD